MKEDNTYYAHETDAKLNPIEPLTYRYFKGKSARAVAMHLAYELNGQARHTMVLMPNGNKWFVYKL